MGDSLDGSGEPSPESQNVAIVEFPTFANYLRKAVTVLLPDEDAVPPAFNLALEERYNQECIRKFLGDSQVSSLYIQRSSTKGERFRSMRRLRRGRFRCARSSIAVGATVHCEKKRVLKINCEHSHALLCETISLLQDMTHSLAGEIDIYDNALINILTRSFFYLFSADFSDRIPLAPRGV